MQMEKQHYHDLHRDDMRLPYEPKPLLTGSFAAKVVALCLIAFLGVLRFDHHDGHQLYARLSGLHRS